MKGSLLALSMVIALSAATVLPALAGGPRKHIDATCIPNGPPGEPTLVAVSEFDLPADSQAFANFSRDCRNFGGHVALIRGFHD